MIYYFCLGMYRSSSTWQYEVISHLAELYQNGVRLGFVEGVHFNELPGKGYGLGRVGVLKTHDVHPLFINELDLGNALPIYSYRDLRDVAFSFMYKAALTFDEMIERKFLEKVIANDARWRSEPRLICQRYESVIADSAGAVAELARGIGLAISGEEIFRVAQEYSWEANFKRTQEVKRRAEAAGIDLQDKAHIFEHDPRTLLHWNHLRAGSRKTWRELATPAQRTILDEICGDWLIANGYECDHAWVAEPVLSGVREETRYGSKVVRIDKKTVTTQPTLWFQRIWARVASRLIPDGR